MFHRLKNDKLQSNKLRTGNNMKDNCCVCLASACACVLFIITSNASSLWSQDECISFLLFKNQSTQIKESCRTDLVGSNYGYLVTIV